MSGYEEEHNISRAAQQAQPRRRVDLSSFHSALEQIDTHGSSDRPHLNRFAEPTPGDVAAVHRQLANAYQVMLGETEGVTVEGDGFRPIDNPLLEGMISALLSTANDPPRELKGVPDSFLDELDRVPKKSLDPDDRCPICRTSFLEDKYPLVVRLPCNKNHMFDLECIAPWLKTNATCPLDRKDLIKKKEPPKPLPTDEDDGDYDDMFA